MVNVIFDIDIESPDEDDEEAEQLVADELARLRGYILGRAVANSGTAEILEAVIIMGNAIEEAREFHADDRVRMN